MKKTVFLILIVILAISAFIIIDPRLGDEINTQRQQVENRVASNVEYKDQEEKEFIFVPYWTLDSNLAGQHSDSFIYFGVSADSRGIIKQGRGYAGAEDFLKVTPPGKEKILAVSMLGTDENEEVLEDKKAQEEIIREAVALTLEKGFDGVLLDFETSAIGFDSVVSSINDFYADFHRGVKDKNLKFYISVFGDNHYRARAYEMQSLASKTDKIFIMAYDFHKSNGTPGPNFPLEGKEIYGYDFKTMVDDFLAAAPQEKLVVVFGMFGYDWEVDDKKRPKSPGVSLSTNQAKARFESKCSFEDCTLKRDKKSGETTVGYTQEGQSHIVWFEDEDSVKRKKDYLKTKGIRQTAFWAYSFY